MHLWAQVTVKIQLPVDGEALQCSNSQPDSPGVFAGPHPQSFSGRAENLHA